MHRNDVNFVAPDFFFLLKQESFVEMVEALNPSPGVKEMVRDATDRVMVMVVFFLLSVSLNILIVLRAVFNKLVLLGSNPEGEVNRVSLFRVRPVDLTKVGGSVQVFRQLWVSFIFDSVELVTVAVWVLYPLYIVAIWSVERECASAGGTSAQGLSPLMSCLVKSREVFIGIGAAFGVVLGLLLLLYFMRFIEERSVLIRGNDVKLLDPNSCRLTHFAPFAIILGILFFVACAGAIISVVMLAKPLNSHLDSEQQIGLAYPGLVLLAGCTLVIFYVGKKLTFAVAIYLNPKISFFFEGACSLTNTTGVNNLAGPKTGDEDTVELSSMYVSLLNDETLLY